MKSKFGQHVLVFALLTAAFSTAFSALQFEYSYDIQKSNEQELRVKIESKLNKIVIAKGNKNSVFSINYNNPSNEIPAAAVKYKIHGNTGYLTIDISEKDENDQGWRMKYNSNSYYKEKVFYITLNNTIPVTLDFHLGAGYGKIDLSGLLVKDLKLETGAAETIVLCDEPNQQIMENFKVDAGLSKFRAYNVGNTNFKNLFFEGGVGSYFFDFNGTIRKEAFVRMELGLGTMSMVIPNNLGASILYNDSFLSSHSFEDFKEIGNGKFVSTNYNNSDGRLNIKIESGLGSIKIKRVNAGW